MENAFNGKVCLRQNRLYFCKKLCILLSSTYRSLEASSSRVSLLILYPFISNARNYLNSILSEKLIKFILLGHHSRIFWTEEIDVLNVATEYKRSDGRQFNENINGWAGGVLEWVSNGVTDNGCNFQFLSYLPLFLNFF